MIDGWGISCEIALIWMSLDFTDDQSTLVQVMAWCRQATSHYLSQCWPRSMLPYGVTRPQCVNTLMLGKIWLSVTGTTSLSCHDETHDDVTWKCFPNYWSFVIFSEVPLSTMDSNHKMLVMMNVDVFFVDFAFIFQWPLLLTRINLNPSMDIILYEGDMIACLHALAAG